MSGRLSGVFSNAYFYEDYIDQDDSWLRSTVKSLGGMVGGAVGGKVGGGAGAIGADTLYMILLNSDQIAFNAQTFVTEVSDWRSWASMMSSVSGGTLSP